MRFMVLHADGDAKVIDIPASMMAEAGQPERSFCTILGCMAVSEVPYRRGRLLSSGRFVGYADAAWGRKKELRHNKAASQLFGATVCGGVVVGKSKGGFYEGLTGAEIKHLANLAADIGALSRLMHNGYGEQIAILQTRIRRLCGMLA